MRLTLALAAVAAMSSSAWAQMPDPTDRVGDVYELSLSSISENSASDGSGGRSSSGGQLVERVVAIRPDGLELEYDLPADTAPEDRARDWQWPARVLWRADQGAQLLNRDELEERIAIWLTAMNIPREACGQWGFSWTAYKIECNPDTVLETLAVYDLRTLPEGARATPASPEGAQIIFEAPVDEATILEEQAETDAALAQILGNDPEDVARRAERAVVSALGTRTVVRESDAEGRPVRQVVTVQLQTTAANGVTETRGLTQTVGRRLVQAGE